MSATKMSRLESFIAETNIVFQSHMEMGEADFAEFASMSVTEFRSLLNRPELTRKQLRAALRHGIAKSRHQATDSSKWASFLASYVSETANIN